MATTDRRGATVSAADPPIGTNPNPDLAIKAPVRVATTGSNINLQTIGLGTIDGVALAAGDRVLVKDQTDATTNGLYNASTGPWTRTIDANNNSQWSQGMQVLVNQGTNFTGVFFGLTTANPIILGTSILAFVRKTVVTPSTNGPRSVFDFFTAAQVNDVTTLTGSIDVTTNLNAAFADASNNKYALFMPGGRYKFTPPLFATPQGSNLQSCHILGAGRGYANGNAPTILDATALTNVPAIIIQRGRGCYLGHFLVLGGNTAPAALTLPNMTYGAAWVTGGLRDSRYSPYCGISIDGGVGSTPPDGGYPGLTYQGATGGSGDITIDHVAVWNFVAGIMHNSESNVSQGDQVLIINPQIQGNKVGIASGQAQANCLTVVGGNITNCRTCFDALEYGQRQGRSALFLQTQFGPGFEIFSFTGSFNPAQLVGCRAESVQRIGQVGVSSSTSAYPLVLDGCDFHVLNPDAYPQARCPVVLEANSSPVEWIGGGLSDDSTTGTASFVLVGQPLTMRGTQIGIMASRFKPYIGGVADFGNPVELRNCRITDAGGAIIYGNESRQFSLSGRFSAHWSEGKIRDASNLYQYQPGAGNNYINIGTQSAIVFSSTQLTFSNTDPAGLQVGDLVMWRFNAIAKSLVQIIAPAAQITGIVSNAITCSLLYPLSYYDQTYNIGATSVVVTEWATAPAQTLTGNTTNTSPTLASVSPTNILRNGDWITGIGIPNFTRVASGANTATITMSRNANANGTGTKLGFGGLKYLDGDPVSADNGDASVGLHPRQDVPVQQWNTTLTANRAITLPDGSQGAQSGDEFQIVRRATGAFTLTANTVDSLSLAATQWARVKFDASAGWRTVAKGSL